MQKIETSCLIEVRRCRIAQYKGGVASLTFGQTKVRGLVQTIREVPLSIPVRWTVTIILK
jgi:hypothetical protein